MSRCFRLCLASLLHRCLFLLLSVSFPLIATGNFVGAVLRSTRTDCIERTHTNRNDLVPFQRNPFHLLENALNGIAICRLSGTRWNNFYTKTVSHRADINALIIEFFFGQTKCGKTETDRPNNRKCRTAPRQRWFIPSCARRAECRSHTQHLDFRQINEHAYAYTV